jgi:hypothetical protein
MGAAFLLVVFIPGAFCNSGLFGTTTNKHFNAVQFEATRSLRASVSKGRDTSTTNTKPRRPPFFGLDLDDPEVRGSMSHISTIAIPSR